jgi:hypothetical protein
MLPMPVRHTGTAAPQLTVSRSAAVSCPPEPAHSCSISTAPLKACKRKSPLLPSHTRGACTHPAQTNLTWLDLSFNHITKIEGLEALTKLTDLSLFSNQVAVIENLTPLSGLQVLSLGNNAIKRLDNVMYLRQFKWVAAPCAEGVRWCSFA